MFIEKVVLREVFRNALVDNFLSELGKTRKVGYWTVVG